MTDQEIRLECVKAACAFCADRVVEARYPLVKAQEFYEWVVTGQQKVVPGGWGAPAWTPPQHQPLTIRSIRRKRMKGAMA